MGYTIAICETECEAALCRDMKLRTTRILVGDGFPEYQGFDEIVPADKAEAAVGDWDAFIARNRLSPETTEVYLDKVKNASDRAALEPLAEKRLTGWVSLEGIDEPVRSEILAAGDPENRITAWQDADPDLISDTCSKCPLSWTRTGTCIDGFGTEKSKLPEIARRAGCPIVGSVFESAESGKEFPPEDAPKLLEEVQRLRPALVEDGKAAVYRYTGTLDKLEAMAKACTECRCGFRFLRGQSLSIPFMR